jgi:hypothetical protein
MGSERDAARHAPTNAMQLSRNCRLLPSVMVPSARLNTLRGSMASYGYSIGKQWSVAFSDWQQPLKKQLDSVDVLVILTRHFASYPGLPPAVPPSTDFAFPAEDLDASVTPSVSEGPGGRARQESRNLRRPRPDPSLRWGCHYFPIFVRIAFISSITRFIFRIVRFSGSDVVISTPHPSADRSGTSIRRRR